MQFTLIVSLKTRYDSDWNLTNEIRGAVQRDMLQPLQPDGVIPIGRDAYLFDETSAHNSFVRVCAYLIGIAWPYIVVPVERCSVLVEGASEETLRSSLSMMRVLSDHSQT